MFNKHALRAYLSWRIQVIVLLERAFTFIWLKFTIDENLYYTSKNKKYSNMAGVESLLLNSFCVIHSSNDWMKIEVLRLSWKIYSGNGTDRLKVKPKLERTTLNSNSFFFFRCNLTEMTQYFNISLSWYFDVLFGWYFNILKAFQWVHNYFFNDFHAKGYEKKF